MTISTLWLDGAQQNNVSRGAELLLVGEAVVFPTDTVYGVGSSPFLAHGISKIYGAKIRPIDKGLPVLLADIDDLSKVADDFPQQAWELAEQHWPGALTLIVPKKAGLPDNLSPNSGIAVRIPDHELGRDLIRQAGGAVATTSANLSGQPPAQTASDALKQLNGRVAAVLDGGLVPGGLPSTIISLMGDRPKVVRAGPIAINC